MKKFIEEIKAADRKQLLEAVEGMKLTGELLHDGDVYTPEDINRYLDDVLSLLRKDGH